MLGQAVRTLLVVTAVLVAFGGPGAGRAVAADARASVLMAFDVRPRAVVFADRPAVTLLPGQSTTVMVTVKARVTAGGTVSIDLGAGGAATRVDYRFLGRSGRLGASGALGAITGSGVHVVPLTLSLPADATASVTVPLALAAAPYGPAMAGLTRVAP